MKNREITELSKKIQQGLEGIYRCMMCLGTPGFKKLAFVLCSKIKRDINGNIVFLE